MTNNISKACQYKFSLFIYANFIFMWFNKIMKTNNINNNYNKQNFTSVMPMKIFIDGKISGSEDNIHRATIKLTEILKGPAKNDEKKLSIIRKFAQHDRDYSYESGYLGFSGEKGKLFRNIIDKTCAYFFTGPQAETMNKIGRKIGPAKGNGKARFENTNTFEAKALAHQYFEQARNFIANQKIKIREFLDPKTRQYSGNELTLNIYTKSSGVYGKKGFKLDVEDIEFSR